MFVKALPVWPAGKEQEMNTLGVFRAEWGSLKGTHLHIAASTFYQLYVNGEFAAAGPARAAQGYVREDVIDLDAFDESRNRLVIMVAGYCCRSLSTVCSPSFVQAELRSGEEPLLWTGRHFEGMISEQRVQKVQRYSMQRHFGEVWDLRKPLFDIPCELTVQPEQKLLDRIAPLPVCREVPAEETAWGGKLAFDEELPYQTQKYSGAITPAWGCFEETEIEYKPFVWIQRQKQIRLKEAERLPLELNAGEYAVLDFERIEAGFFRFEAEVREETELVIAFTELSEQDCFTFTAINAHNALEWILPAGDASGMSFEPYTARYALVAVKRGRLRLKRFGILTYEADTSKAYLPAIDDGQLAAVCRGAVRTYAHNAVDLYTDCPSRERAGWLCDSYFTARTEHFLFGRVPVEKAFLENFRLYRNEGELPEGALPMCYPADIPDDGKFIPQWTMWYILEVYEYLTIRAPQEDRELFRESVEGLLQFYRRYENEDGLLERLPKWNFVEWSRANEWTRDVNYPTNFLYAQVLQAAAELYGNDELRVQSEQVRREAVRQSFNGTLFLDHAVRNEQNVLVRQPDCSEICQYYAILFAGIDLNQPEYVQLKRLVTHVFGAQRRQPMPEVEEINAFIGIYLRLEALLKMGENELVMEDIRGFFGRMEQETGTLWESRQWKRGSKDHGFASYALVALSKAMAR